MKLGERQIMQTLQFRNQDQMPILGLGTWKSKPGEVYDAVKQAISLGYHHIDCAHIYGNETEIGKALSELFQEGVVTRDQLWITSKLWNNAHAPEAVEPALRTTLEHLQLEYLDLYLIHWPVVWKQEVSFPKTAEEMISLEDLPILKTWSAMEDLVDRDLCRHIGVSNFSEVKLQGLLDHVRIPPEMNQIELHPYLQQPQMVEFCRQHQIHLTAYSPLGSSDRPESLRGESEPVVLENEVIVEIAKQHGVTPAQVLIGWAIHRGTAVIPKTVKSHRLQENLASAEISLTSEDMQRIAELDRHYRYVTGAFFALEGGPYTLANIWDE